MWRFLWDTSTQTNRNAVLTAGWLLVFNTVGLGLAAAAWGPYWSGAVLWGMALASISFVVGFLFGVPKFEKPSAGPNDAAHGGLSVNTNLERVSDWLTNIIVGLTLVNLGKIEFYGGRLAEQMVKVSGGDAVPVTWAIAMIIYFPSMGFLGGYLLTRMFLSQAFGEADRALGFQEQEKIRQALPASFEDKPAVSADTRQAMAAIQNMDPRMAVQSGVGLDVLAGAQLSANRPDAALTTSEEALRKDATNPRLHYMRALALNRLGRMGDALGALRNARAALTPNADAGLRASIYNSLTYRLLYENTAEAARAVVLLVEEYLKVDPTGAHGALLVNLACACGQLAKFAGSDAAAVREQGTAALAAIEAALKQDPAWLSKLRSLYHPAPNSQDDDLAVFAQSELAPQFDEALALKAASTNA